MAAVRRVSLKKGYEMAVREVLLLGNPQLYEASTPVREGEVEHIRPLVEDLHDTLMDFRRRFSAGRAITSPQIGVMKRLIYLHIDEPLVIINPVMDWESREMIEVWDDCMCFPDLLVKVSRHQRCRITYRDLNWKETRMDLEGDLSELIQHEYDHLEGILAVSRAIDRQSFALRSQRKFLP
jgi:peptide deformylase